jgi:hypothetical protein
VEALALDGERELAEDRFEPVTGHGVESEFVVSAAQVLHERMPDADRLGAAQPFQPAHWPGPRFQTAVINFDRVVGVLLHHAARAGHGRREFAGRPVPGR